MTCNDKTRLARALTTRFAPSCWVGICVRVIDSATVDRVADHYLAAAWAPVDAGLTRWPEAVVIGSPTASRALDELLRHLPRDAKLFLAGKDDVDAALAADILLAGDRNLGPRQREAVAMFARAERARTQAALAARYTDRDPDFERFRSRVLDAPKDLSER